MAATNSLLTPVVEVLRTIRDEKIRSSTQKATLIQSLSEHEQSLIPVLLTAQRRHSYTKACKIAKTHKRMIDRGIYYTKRAHTTVETITPAGLDSLLTSGSVYAYVESEEDREYLWGVIFDPKRLYLGDSWVESLPGGWEWLMPQMVPNARYYGVMRPIDLPYELFDPINPDFRKWAAEEKADGRNIMLGIYKSKVLRFVTRGGKEYWGSKSVLKDRMIYAPAEPTDSKLLYVLNGELLAGDASGVRPAEESACAGTKKPGLFVAYDVVYSYSEEKPVYSRSLRTRRKILEGIISKYTGSECVYEPYESFQSSHFLWMVRRYHSTEEIEAAMASGVEGIVYKRLGEPYYGIIGRDQCALEEQSVHRRKSSWYRWKHATTITVMIERGKYGAEGAPSLEMLVTHKGTMHSVGFVTSLSEEDRQYLRIVGYADDEDGTFALDAPIYAEVVIDATKTVAAGSVPFRHPRLHRFRTLDEGFKLTTYSELL